jgi:hypothetical protein
MTCTKERWCAVNQFLWVVDIRCVDLVFPLTWTATLIIWPFMNVSPFIHVLLKQNMDTYCADGHLILASLPSSAHKNWIIAHLWCMWKRKLLSWHHYWWMANQYKREVPWELNNGTNRRKWYEHFSNTFGLSFYFLYQNPLPPEFFKILKIRVYTVFSSLLYVYPIPYIIYLNNCLWPTLSILLMNFYY